MNITMNYSIVFTEICFYPETSILLQIIRIIHMTIGILPELFVTEMMLFQQSYKTVFFCSEGKRNAHESSVTKKCEQSR